MHAFLVDEEVGGVETQLCPLPTSSSPDPDDKVASWWDYGYQTTAMANRTVIVDNNTWNNTHIATVRGGGVVSSGGGVVGAAHWRLLSTSC